MANINQLNELDRAVAEGEWIRGVFFRHEDLAAMRAAIHLSKQQPVNVLMVGPSGYGKTTMPAAIATQHHRDYVRINCARVRDPEEWFGYREAVGGATEFVPTEFTSAVEKGNAIIVLDEFNRVEPWLHNTLYPLLDDSRKTIVHNREITVGPKTIFCATVNLGYTFTGTFTLDSALMNRMDLTVLVQELPEQVEVELLIKRFSVKANDARLIVKSIAGLRKVAVDKEIEADLSTRTSLKIARLIKARMSLKLALQYTLLNLLNQDEKKASVDTVNTILSQEGATKIRLDGEGG